MKIYIDTDNKKLVRSETDSTSPGKQTFVAGDSEPIELMLLTRGTDTLFEPVAISNGDTVCVAIARFKGDPKVLSISGDTPIAPSGKASVVLPLNTKEIYEALGDSTALSGAYFEVQVSYANGNISTIYQEQCNLKGDLIKGIPSVSIQEQFCSVGQVDAKIATLTSAAMPFSAIKLAVEGSADEYGYLVLQKDENGIYPVYKSKEEFEK